MAPAVTVTSAAGLSGASGVAAPAMALYEETKAELSAMEYREFLGLESLHLVRRLLHDLVLTSESHERNVSAKNKAEKNSHEAKEQLFALKRENSRLVRDNNELHLSLIKEKETLDARERALGVEARAARDKAAEAAFVAAQWKQRLEEAEVRLDSFRSAASTGKPARADLTLSDNLVAGPARAGNEDKGEVARREKVALQESMRALEERLAGVTRDAESLRSQLATATNAVELRENECRRLGKELMQREVGVVSQESLAEAADVRAREIQTQSNQQVLAQLYEQIDFLNAQAADQKQKLETASKDSKALEVARAELKKKNTELRHALVKLGGGEKQQNLNHLKSSVTAIPPSVNENESAFANNGKFESVRATIMTDLDAAKREELAALLEAYSEDKRKFSSTVLVLERELADARANAAQLQVQVERETAGGAESAAGSAVLQKKVILLEAELSNAQRALTQIHSDHVSTLESRAEFAKEIESLEEQLAEQGADLVTVKTALEESSAAQKQQEYELNSLRSECVGMEERAVAAEDGERHASSAQESLRAERDALARQAENLLGEGKTLAVRAHESRVEAQAAQASCEHAQGRCRVLEEEVRGLSLKLAAKAEQYHKEAGQRAELEMLAELPGAVSELEEQLARWRDRAADLDTESKRVARELEDAWGENRSLMAERTRMDAAMAELRDKRDAANGELRKTTLLAEELQLKLAAADGERETLATQVSVANQQLSERSAEGSALMAGADALKTRTKQAEERREMAERRENVLSEQCTALRDSNARAVAKEAQLQAALHASKAECDQLQRQAATLEREANQLRGEEKRLVLALAVSEDRVREGESAAVVEKAKYHRMDMQIEQFKAVFGKLDDQRAVLQKRIKEFHGALKSEKVGRAALDTRCEQLAETARAASDKADHLSDVVKKLTDQRASLRQQVEQHTASNGALEAAVQRQEMAFREVEQRLSTAKQQLHAQLKSLDARDTDVERLEAERAAAERRADSLQQLADQRGAELTAAATDLASMTRENQAVNSACQTLRMERDGGRSQLSEALSRAARLDGLLESAKLEKADLLNVYRRACDENSRMKRLVQELSSSRAKVVGENQAAAVDGSRLRQRLAEREEQCRRQQVDLTAFERQVAELSRQMHVMQSKLEANEEDKSYAERTAATARETSSTFAQREQSLMWEIAQHQAEIDKLSAKSAKLHADNEALHNSLLREKRRYQDLEMVVVRARAAQAQAEQAERSKDETVQALRNVMLDQEISATQDLAAADLASEESKFYDAQGRSKEFRLSQVPVSPLTTGATGGSGSVSTTSSDADQMASELEGIISDQADVIRGLRQDRERFGQATSRANQASSAREEEMEESSLHKSRSGEQ